MSASATVTGVSYSVERPFDETTQVQGDDVVRVLGVDPGLTRCGYGVVDGTAGRNLTAVDHGVLTTFQLAHALFPSLDFCQRRLRTLYQLRLVARFRPRTEPESAEIVTAIEAQLAG